MNRSRTVLFLIIQLFSVRLLEAVGLESVTSSSFLEQNVEGKGQIAPQQEEGGNKGAESGGPQGEGPEGSKGEPGPPEPEAPPAVETGALFAGQQIGEKSVTTDLSKDVDLKTIPACKYYIQNKGCDPEDVFSPCRYCRVVKKKGKKVVCPSSDTFTDPSKYEWRVKPVFKKKLMSKQFLCVAYAKTAHDAHEAQAIDTEPKNRWDKYLRTGERSQKLFFSQMGRVLGLFVFIFLLCIGILFCCLYSKKAKDVPEQQPLERKPSKRERESEKSKLVRRESSRYNM